MTRVVQLRVRFVLDTVPSISFLTIMSIEEINVTIIAFPFGLTLSSLLSCAYLKVLLSKNCIRLVQCEYIAALFVRKRI